MVKCKDKGDRVVRCLRPSTRRVHYFEAIKVSSFYLATLFSTAFLNVESSPRTSSKSNTTTLTPRGTPKTLGGMPITPVGTKLTLLGSVEDREMVLNFSEQISSKPLYVGQDWTLGARGC